MTSTALKAQNHAETEPSNKHFPAAKRSDLSFQNDADDTRKPPGEREKPGVEIIEFSDPWGDKYYVLKTDFDPAKNQGAKWVNTCNSSGGPTNARRDVTRLGLVFLEFSSRRDYVVGQVAQANLPVSATQQEELEQTEDTPTPHLPNAALEEESADEYDSDENALHYDLEQVPAAYNDQTSPTDEKVLEMENDDQAVLSSAAEPAQNAVLRFTFTQEIGPAEVYHVRWSDLKIALENSDVSVVLCQIDGTAVPDDAEYGSINVQALYKGWMEELVPQVIQGAKLSGSSRRIKVKR